jgi:hypothetical protein
MACGNGYVTIPKLLTPGSLGICGCLPRFKAAYSAAAVWDLSG